MICFTKRQQVHELLEHSKTEAPDEACGILAGKAYSEQSQDDKKVEKVYPMTNVKASPEAFFMDSKEQFKIMKEIRNLKLEMVGIYHSHPKTEAYPSAHDVELANYPEISYVIVSIEDKDNPVIRSFRIVDGKIKEEAISVIHNS